MCECVCVCGGGGGGVGGLTCFCELKTYVYKSINICYRLCYRLDRLTGGPQHIYICMYIYI